jgi:mono/diheme cytochrome c family protein
MRARRLRCARIAVALAGAAILAACTVSRLALDTKAVPATQPAPLAVPLEAGPVGQRLYGRHCLSCHQADGGGVPDMQPAIKGGTWVTGDSRALALFVMSGGFDSAARKDSDVGNVMPAFRQLPDEDLAQILSFIRAKFGQGASPVTAAEVAQARASLP